MNHILPPDTQAILLLCASFGQNREIEPQPLTLGEYNSLAKWLQENKMRPADLLIQTGKVSLQDIPENFLDYNRLFALLERGMLLSLAVEKWTNQGLWILARSDAEYPKRLKQILKHLAPTILYGVGNKQQLSQGGLAIVGSRDVDEEGLNYTQKIAQLCAEEQIQIVSGGARGVDQMAMLSALEAGGTAVGVLADSLAKAAVAGKYRQSIKDGKLTLISAYDPHAGFNAGNAMNRNKYIYALSNYSLVISSDFKKGGTWAGAVEALQKIKDVPCFVRQQGNIPEGNLELIKKGAKPFYFIPGSSLKGLLQTLLETETSEVMSPNSDKQLSLFDEVNQVSDMAISESEKTSVLNAEQQAPVVNEFPELPKLPQNIYEAVLPLILSHLEKPLDAKSLAERLDVQLKQMQIWLNKAVEDGKVQKNKKPVTYVVIPNPV